MQRSDVALWLTPFSCWPDDVAFVYADAASLAVVQLNSAATLLLSLGIHPKVVQELLGHTQISITMDVYSHMLPGMQQDAIGKLNEVLKKQEGDEKRESS